MCVSFHFSLVHANQLYRARMKRFLLVKKKLLALSVTGHSQFTILMAILMSSHPNSMYVSNCLWLLIIIHISSFSMLSSMTVSKTLWNLFMKATLMIVLLTSQIRKTLVWRNWNIKTSRPCLPQTSRTRCATSRSSSLGSPLMKKCSSMLTAFAQSLVP